VAVLTRIVACACLLLTASGCRSGQEQWGPFRGQVVDEETGKPIAGANVMVLWIREPPSLHFTQSFYDAQETVTDVNGRFEIPPRHHWLTAWVEKPDIGIFVPHYLMQSPRVIPSDGRSYLDETVVPMRPLRTQDERCRNEWRGPLIDVGPSVPVIMRAIRQNEKSLQCS